MTRAGVSARRPDTPPLGRLVVLTDRRQAATAGHDLTTVVRQAARAGADTVVFREKDLPPARRAALADEVSEVLDATATALVVASDTALAHRVGAIGVHLARADRSTVVGGLLVGRSCHDLTEVAAAGAEGVDYLFVSPVSTTTSKPGYGPALGSAGASRLAERGAPGTAAYGLGGITPGSAAACRHAGLSGVAVMGAVMAARDPALVTAELKRAVTSPVGVGS